MLYRIRNQWRAADGFTALNDLYRGDDVVLAGATNHVVDAYVMEHAQSGDEYQEYGMRKPLSIDMASICR